MASTPGGIRICAHQLRNCAAAYQKSLHVVRGLGASATASASRKPSALVRSENEEPIDGMAR
jgi:hypothetical protein